MKVIVTGGCGYIGSTICSALSDSGHTPIIWDSLVTGEKSFAHSHAFYCSDITCSETLDVILRDHPEVSTVIHCAARIVVPESMQEPHLYYTENVTKSLVLFQNLRQAGLERIVFSSSASVYAQTIDFAVREQSPRAPQSPYARTKAMMEDILIDFGAAYGTKSILLRYFNPIGSDPKMRTGPFVPNPSHLLGRLVQTALTPGSVFSITGCNWPTRDGSGIRDYVHVWDLALAHVQAVEKFDEVIAGEDCQSSVINLGTGSGITVKEFVAAFERVYGNAIHKVEAPSRPGDNAGCFTIAAKAKKCLQWSAPATLDLGISTALEWTRRWRGHS